MVLDRLQQLSLQMDSKSPPPHPLDPLSEVEIEKTVAIIRTEHSNERFKFNGITLLEPPKAEMLAWLSHPDKIGKPARKADIVILMSDGKVYDSVVNLTKGVIEKWEHVPGVQPIITVDEIKAVEHLARKDPKIIEQCGIIGIPPEDMHKVYCDRMNPITFYLMSIV